MFADRFREAAKQWARGQVDVVSAAAMFADSDEWVKDGAPSAANWLAIEADVCVSTAREWIRVGRQLRGLQEIDKAFRSGGISYSKVRALLRLATPDNERELLAIARAVPAGQIRKEVAAWMFDNFSPAEIDQVHQQGRAVRFHVEPDGSHTVVCRFPPLVGALVRAKLDAIVSRRAARGLSRNTDGSWATLAHQRCDGMRELIGDDDPTIAKELVIHLAGNGLRLDDGTPLPMHLLKDVADSAFLRALIHDAEGNPVNASSKRRSPTTRQKRVVQARDQGCVDCGTTDFLEFDHDPPFSESERTRTDELSLRCSACHRRRHRLEGGSAA